MSSTISLNYQSKLDITETLTGDYVSGANNDFAITGLSTGDTYNGTTTPAVTKHAENLLAMSGGAATLDLTALAGELSGQTVDATGLKLQFAKLRAKSDNGATLTVTKGGTNGYSICGTAAFTIPLAPGQEILLNCNAASGTVGSGAKTFDLAGTGTDALEYELIFG